MGCVVPASMPLGMPICHFLGQCQPSFLSTPPACATRLLLLQSGVFTQPSAAGSAVTAASIPFLDWLNYLAAHAAATAVDDGAADGPAAKRRRISELSGTQGGTAAGGCGF